MAGQSVVARQYRYFLYSQEQYKLRKQTEANLGKTYIPGQVLVNGRWKDYTEISSRPSNYKFADAKIIAEGYLDSVNYKKATNEWRMR